MKPERGLISSIERFAVHDGPGIRTLVFMKGCPLRCLWCSSPQTQKNYPQIMYDIGVCRKCGACDASCPALALSFSPDKGVKIDFQLCNGCGECVNTCPNKALRMVGRYLTAEELFQEIAKDSAFFRRSKGGVTVGGGEPALQHQFVAEFLKKCTDRHIHTALETCGHSRWEKLDQILEYTDMVFMDIKHMDDPVHRKITGVSNRLIQENARRVSGKRPLVIRIPVVPGCNDSDKNIRATAEFAAQLGGSLLRVELLPYHKLGLGDYQQLGMKYRLGGVEPPSDQHLERLRAIAEGCGISARIEGEGP